jgi:predicted DNA-binding protein
MLQNIPSKKVRLNVQIPFELKDKLTWASVIEGKKMSVLVRESIEQKLRRIEKRVFEEKMKNAYLDLARENLEISKDFEYSDAENL